MIGEMVFVDDKGRTVFISQGLGAGRPDAPWGIFRRKSNGSLQRVLGKYDGIPLNMVPTKAGAEFLLKSYAKAKGWVTREEFDRRNNLGTRVERPPMPWERA